MLDDQNQGGEDTTRRARNPQNHKQRAQTRNPCLGSPLCRLSAGPTADPDSPPLPSAFTPAVSISTWSVFCFSINLDKSICVTEETDECAPNLRLSLFAACRTAATPSDSQLPNPLQPSTHPSHHPSTQPPAPAQAYVHSLPDFPGERASSVALWLDRTLKRYQLPSLRAPGNRRLTLPFPLPQPSTLPSSPKSHQTCPSLSPSSLPSAAPSPVWAPWYVAFKPHPVGRLQPSRRIVHDSRTRQPD